MNENLFEKCIYRRWEEEFYVIIVEEEEEEEEVADGFVSVWL